MKLPCRPASLAWLATLVVAAALRLPALTAGFPYLSYVDEGHVLRPVVRILSQGTWDPGFYIYPSLPIYLTAAAALIWSPISGALYGRSLAESAAQPYFDVIEPVDLVVIGRLTTLAVSLGIVLLTRSLARRLAGEAAGLAALWLAAWVPALVIRGAIVSVDPFAAFFTLAALVAAERLAADPGDHHAALAGACAGLAAVSKYPAVLVGLPVVLSIWLSQPTAGRRLRQLLVAGAAGSLSAVVAMPALVLRAGEVMATIRWLTHYYRTHARGSFWRQATTSAEWDLPYSGPEVGVAFLLLASAGLAVGLRQKSLRRTLGGGVLFGASLTTVLAVQSFRPFRNLLALVPLAVVLVALLYAAVRRRARRPWLVDAAAFVLPLLLWLPPLAAYERQQLAFKDSREEAVHYLAASSRLNERLFLDPDLAFNPSRIASLPVRTASLPWAKARRAALRGRFEWLVLRGDLVPRPVQRVSFVDRELILARYRIVATFGEPPSTLRRGRFRANRQLIYVLKRRPFS